MRQIDSGLIDEFRSMRVQDYEVLRYTNDPVLKDAFLAGDVREPNLQYGDIPLYALDIDRLLDFEAIVRTFDNELVRRAYLPKIELLQQTYRLLDAAARGDDETVFEASRAKYGLPRDDLFHFCLRDLNTRLDLVQASFGDDPRVARALEVLRPTTVLVANTTYPWDEFPFPEVPEQTGAVCTAQEIKMLCEEAFTTYGIVGWQAVVEAPGERMTFNTNQALRTVFIPSDTDLSLRKYPMTRMYVDALIAHEIGTHVVRRENGDASPLGLLGIGLANYLRGEEGVATYAEHKVEGTRHFAGMFGYLSVAWAVGLDGTPRTFRGLFEVLVPYMVVSGLEHALAYGLPVDLDVLEARSARKAWARALRIFRGTTGTTPGCCFTKDIVYLEGNIAIWQLVHKDPGSAATFHLGKYDPTNAEHVAILRDLGML
jgi:hypothetical protein